MKINNFKSKEPIILNIIVLIIGWISYMLDGSGMTKAVIFVLIPLVSFYIGVITKKLNKPLKYEILLSTLTVLLIVRKIILITIFGIFLSIIFIILGGLSYSYYLYEKNTIENINDESIKKQRILSNKLMIAPAVMNIFIGIVGWASLILFGLFFRDINIIEASMADLITENISGVIILFEIRIIPITAIIIGAISSYNKIKSFKIMLPTIIIGVFIVFILGLEMGYIIIFFITALIETVIGMIIGKIILYFKDKKRKVNIKENL